MRRLGPGLLVCLMAGALAFQALGARPPVVPVRADDTPASVPVSNEEKHFQEHVQPLFKQYCVRCHNVDVRKSGIRVDNLTGIVEDQQIPLWKGILKELDDEAMPPDNEPQPTEEERKVLGEWVPKAISAAMARNTQKNGLVRRLTVSQYRNTLRDLLGLEENLTETLPPDGVSKDGFTNNGQAMVLSPLQVEAYFEIAEKALDLCLVDERKPPEIQSFRMELGKALNIQPCPDQLILGANNELLNNPDFVVTDLKPEKPFEYIPKATRTKYEFIEGYAGNDTVRGWRKYDSIYHAIFACMRGTPGYPKGLAYETISAGLLLRPAIPSPEIFGESNTYGPMANFKISLRELPETGNFRVTVNAARYEDGLLLNPGSPLQNPTQGVVVGLEKEPKLSLSQPGIYQVDVYRQPGEDSGLLNLTLGERFFSGQLRGSKPTAEQTQAKEQGTAFLVARLPVGEISVNAHANLKTPLQRLVFTRLAEDHELAKRFLVFENRTPALGVHVGLRRDCGSTLRQVGDPQVVPGHDLQTFVFEGAINDFPSPEVEKDNVNYLAGIREIGVRSEYTDGRDMPRLLIRAVEFEGPYYATWPPETHRRIFLDSPHRDDSRAYAREIVHSFASRAFRRPVTIDEEQAFFAVWESTFAERGDFQRAIKDALLVVLTSPQFLFLVETSHTPDPEPLDSYELASKLSYFLWNTAPDSQLLDLAARDGLYAALDAEIDRMIEHPRFRNFCQEFASQWLSLDKFDVVAIDQHRFPQLTRDAKANLRQEPIHYLQYLIEHNQPVRSLVRSDFVVANEVVANYYGLANSTESGFQFVPIPRENSGGVLTQASILSGLSNGREANPIKRGAWLARKIVAMPPDDPPPNVPQIKEDDGAKLTLRQKLEQHRNQPGCAKCHSGIDPWGLPFEKYNAAGLFDSNPQIEARSKLPDGTEVDDLNGLMAHLAGPMLDDVAFSFLKHVAIYATGRSLTYNELVYLREEGLKFSSTGYRMKDLIRFVIHSDIFLKK